MNIHFDNPLQSLTKQTLTTLSLYGLFQVINKPTHRCGHIIDWVIVRPEDDIHKKYIVTDSLNQTIIALNPTSMFQSLSLLPYTGLLGTLQALTAHYLLLNFEHIGLVVRMSILDTEVDGSNPSISMFSP